MFLEPEDAQVEICGWPWHGLIVDGVLTLPSGRTMLIANSDGFDFNNTSLWDIGLPDPAYVSDDPDEQWLGKAIIRGYRYFYGGEDPEWPAGAEQYSNPPVYVGGELRKARDLAVNTSSIGGGVFQVRAEIRIDGVLYQSNALSSTEIGLVPGTFSSLSAGIIDHRWDRGRWLISVSAAGRRVALAEASLSVAGGLMFELGLIAGDAALSVMDLTVDEPVNIPPSQRHTGVGSLDGEPIAGTYRARRTGRFLTTAFYNLDASVELVYLHVDAESEFQTTDVTQPEHTRTWTNTGTIRLECSLGSTSSLSFECSMEHYANANAGAPVGSAITRIDKINGSEVFRQEGTGSGGWGFITGDVPAWAVGPNLTAQLDWQLGRPFGDWGSVLSVGLATPSNCIAQASATATWFPSGAPQVTLVHRSSAITPSGIDPGDAFIDSRTTSLQDVFRFQRGSYNPITGQTVRNQREHNYSWI